MIIRSIRSIGRLIHRFPAPACSSHLTKLHQTLESTGGRPIWPHRSSMPGSRAPMAMPSCLHVGGDSVAARLAQHRVPPSLPCSPATPPCNQAPNRTRDRRTFVAPCTPCAAQARPGRPPPRAHATPPRRSLALPCSLCRPWTRPSTTGRRSHNATVASDRTRAPRPRESADVRRSSPGPPRPIDRAARTHGTPATARTCPSRPSLAPAAMRRVHRAPAARL